MQRASRVDTHKCTIAGISAEGERNIDATFVIFIGLIFFFCSTVSKLLYLPSHAVVVHLSFSNPVLSSSLWKARIRGFAVVHLLHRKDPCPSKGCFHFPDCCAAVSPTCLIFCPFSSVNALGLQGPLKMYFSLCIEHVLMLSLGHTRIL